MRRIVKRKKKKIITIITNVLIITLNIIKQT